MATNGQLLRKLAAGNPLLESEIQQLERAFDGYDRYSRLIEGAAKTITTVRFDRLEAGNMWSDVPITRGVTYSFISNPAVPTADYTDVSFSATEFRGIIKPADACVIFKPGTTNEFIRNPVVPEYQSIFMIGEVGWEYFAGSGTVRNFFEVSLDSYVDGVYDGSYYSYAVGEWGFLTNTVIAHSTIDNNESYRLSVYQDTGSTLDIVSCNLTFFLV